MPFGLGKPNIKKMLKKRDVPALCTALSHKDFKVRIDANLALGEIGDKRAIEPLIATLQDPHLRVRNSVANTLGKIVDSRTVEPLIAALQDPERRVRASVACTLGKIGDSRAVEPLIAALKNSEPHGDFSYGVVEALGKIGDRRAVEPIIAVVNNPESYVRLGEGVNQAMTLRWIAVKALGKIGDRRAVEPIIAALKNPEQYATPNSPNVGRNAYYIRRCAVEALGKIGDNRAVEPLKAALNDSNIKVREEAAKALGMIGDERVMERGVEPTKIVFSETDFGSAQKFICSECGEEIPYAIQYEPPDLAMRCSGIARKCSCGWTCCLRCDPTYNQPENGHKCPQCGKFHEGWVRWDPHRNMVDRSGWIQIDGEPDYWLKGGLWKTWKKDRESNRWVTIQSALVKRLNLSDGKKE